MVVLLWGEWPGLGTTRGKPVGPVKLISVSVPVMSLQCISLLYICSVLCKISIPGGRDSLNTLSISTFSIYWIADLFSPFLRSIGVFKIVGPSFLKSRFQLIPCTERVEVILVTNRDSQCGEIVSVV